MFEDFPARLKFFRAKNNLSQVELAKLIGISGKQVSDYEVGTSKPRQGTFFKILNALNVSQDEFLFADIHSPNDVGFNIIGNTEIGSITISNTILKKLRCTLDDLVIKQVTSDSMSPTLKVDDVVLINRLEFDALDNQIFLVEYADEEMFVRTLKEPDGSITLARDNSNYRSINVKPEDIDIQGKVVYRQGLI